MVTKLSLNETSSAVLILCHPYRRIFTAVLKYKRPVSAAPKMGMTISLYVCARSCNRSWDWGNVEFRKERMDDPRVRPLMLTRYNEPARCFTYTKVKTDLESTSSIAPCTNQHCGYRTRQKHFFVSGSSYSKLFIFTTIFCSLEQLSFCHIWFVCWRCSCPYT